MNEEYFDIIAGITVGVNDSISGIDAMDAIRVAGIVYCAVLFTEGEVTPEAIKRFFKKVQDHQASMMAGT